MTDNLEVSEFVFLDDLVEKATKDVVSCIERGEWAEVVAQNETVLEMVVDSLKKSLPGNVELAEVCIDENADSTSMSVCQNIAKNLGLSYEGERLPGKEFSDILETAAINAKQDGVKKVILLENVHRLPAQELNKFVMGLNVFDSTKAFSDGNLDNLLFVMTTEKKVDDIMLPLPNRAKYGRKNIQVVD